MSRSQTSLRSKRPELSPRGGDLDTMCGEEAYTSTLYGSLWCGEESRNVGDCPETD
jgi:hypothetical protein